MERAKSASADRGRSNDAKQALLLEYDAADFRGRHDLLDREGLTIRDVARWRREVARQTTATGNTGGKQAPAAGRAKTTKPVVLDDATEAAAVPSTADDETAATAEPSTSDDEAATASAKPAKAGRGRSRRAAEPVTSPSSPAGPLSALRSDVVAAHASALVYHADALARLVAEAPKTPNDRHRSSAIERVAEAARQTSAAAREVLSARRRSGSSDIPARDAVDVSAELTDMLSTLTDYSSLAVAVQLLARELNPADAAEPGRGRRAAPSHRRGPWWGAEGEPEPAKEASPGPRERHTWGAKRSAS